LTPTDTEHNRPTPETLIKRSLLVIFLLIWLTGAGLTLATPLVRYRNIEPLPGDPTGSLLMWFSADNVNLHPYFFTDLRTSIKDWIADIPPVETVYLLFTETDGNFDTRHARNLIHLSWIWVYPRPLVSLNVELDSTSVGEPAFIPEPGDGVVILAGSQPLPGRDCLPTLEGLYLCR
jgi:hypothetical protein